MRGGGKGNERNDKNVDRRDFGNTLFPNPDLETHIVNVTAQVSASNSFKQAIKHPVMCNLIPLVGP